MRLHSNLLWDTCAIIALIRDGLEPSIPGCILTAQSRQLRYVPLPLLRDTRWVDYRGSRVDNLLLDLSLKGYVVVTLDRALVRRIRSRGGRVLHYKTVRDQILGHGYHPWIL